MARKLPYPIDGTDWGECDGRSKLKVSTCSADYSRQGGSVCSGHSGWCRSQLVLVCILYMVILGLLSGEQQQQQQQSTQAMKVCLAVNLLTGGAGDTDGISLSSNSTLSIQCEQFESSCCVKLKFLTPSWFFFCCLFVCFVKFLDLHVCHGCFVSLLQQLPVC